MKIDQNQNRLIMRKGRETVWIDPWGKDGFRVRVTKQADMDPMDWALDFEPDIKDVKININNVSLVEPWIPEEEKVSRTITSQKARIQNGKIIAEINPEGWICFKNNKNEILIEEFYRDRERIDRYCVPLRIEARELIPIMGTDNFRLSVRFEAYEDEKIYGMGQYQDKILNKKGASLELAHRNCQASIPFMISSRGYGFLWNNPAIGRATFGTNMTEWTAESTKKIDYYITAGDTPATILENYVNVTGKAPMIPKYGMGLWQCKLRYRTQDEILTVAREYHKRGIPLSVIVVDFFHWTRQGDFKFEKRDFPDPKFMIDELNSMGIELMVSVWPTIDKKSENFSAMQEAGYLVTTDRGMNINMNWMGETIFFDATHPEARKFVWEACRKNYYDLGVKLFWLDEAEPEFGPYDFDLHRYYLGPALSCTNIYPVLYAKGFHDGMIESGHEGVINLVRCGWAGSQKYGALIWSGDVSSTFRALREQLQIGLSVGMAGIPWWTTDIGGFLGGDVNDSAFHELLLRWFAFGVFSPVFRLHGERVPHIQPEQEVINGVTQMFTGSGNEIYSYGEKNYEIMKSYVFMRERLKPYIEVCMKEAHEKGTPVMRTMFYVFPEDPICWEQETQYMFGPDILVAPIFEAGATARSVYLPQGESWKDAFSGKIYEGGQSVYVEAPIDRIPLFVRSDKNIPIYQNTDK